MLHSRRPAISHVAVNALMVTAVAASSIALGVLAVPHSPALRAASSAALPTAMRDKPWAITAGHDGAMWFTELGGNRIGRISMSGAVREFSIPTPRSGPQGIVWGPDNAVWFTEAYADQLGRLDPTTGHITEFPVPQLGSEPGMMAVGGDGALYFAENTFGSIGRFTPRTGLFQTFGLSTGPTPDLTLGPDGAIWFTSAWGGALEIGRLSAGGGIAFFQDKAQFGDATSDRIVVGTGGALWFTQTGSSALGRVTTAGSFSQIAVAGGPAHALAAGAGGNLWFGLYSPGIGLVTKTGQSRVFTAEDHVVDSPIEDIVAGPDKNMWFTLPGIDRIGRLTPTGVRSEFAILSGPPLPFGLAVAADGSAWFTLPESNRVGHVDRAGHLQIYTPPTRDSEPAGIAVASDGSAWFVEYRGRHVTHVTESGVMHEYSTSLPALRPEAVAVTPTGQVWWTESPFGLLGSLDPATGRVALFVSAIGTDTDSIAAGTNGLLWLTDSRAHAIARFDPSTGNLAVFPVPKQGAQPLAIAATGDGSFVFLLDGMPLLGHVTAAGHISLQQVSDDGPILGIAGSSTTTYFTDPDANRIGQTSTGGTITYLPIPTANSGPVAIATGPNGDVWFVESNSGHLGRLDRSSGMIQEYTLATAP